MDTFGTRARLTVGDRDIVFASLPELERRGYPVGRLPYSLRILLENLLRHEDGLAVRAEDIEGLARWQPRAEPAREIAFSPARVVLQDFTGVPALVDLAAMRDAMAALGGDPRRIDPLQPVELVVDHSIQVDAFGAPDAFARNAALDYGRNMERYTFLRWGQQAFRGFTVVPPNTGIVHQVNLERLARVVCVDGHNGSAVAYPDTLVGTDSHTPMVNGLGVLGWGVGGIEAEAAMLGQPLSMLVPRVVGLRLTGRLREGVTATDLVLTVTELLRKTGVVGKFVECFGPGLAALTVADRATIGNMSPEYGATVAIFPPDDLTLAYLRFTGRSAEHVAIVEAYLKAQGLFATPGAPEAEYSQVVPLDLGSIEPCVAGPSRPQERVPLGKVGEGFRAALPGLLPKGAPVDSKPGITHGDVVIAAITSCTNTSNPAVMLAAGLLARNAVDRGLTRKPWVKTSLAPGSKAVTAAYARAGLTPPLEALGFHLVGYGCTTCIGNSGPLPPEISAAIADGGLVVASALSGNRNFEGRIHPEVRANYLMSPPLVVAYALVGRIDHDFERQPLGHDPTGEPVFLRDIWPSNADIERTLHAAVASELYTDAYADLLRGDSRWAALSASGGTNYPWQSDSTYVRRPPYFDGMPAQAPARVPDPRGLRVLAVLGDSVTTDHISPAGSIKADSPAGRWLVANGVPPAEFNSYGARRGNHEVMMRGTFASVRIRNRMVPEVEGGFTRYLPTGEVLPIYDAAERYRADGTPLVVLAGKDYGSGSSRDWAAKGPMLLGVRVVIAESFERIHRSNLVGMGILPLQFEAGESAAKLGLDGSETFDVEGGADRELTEGRDVTVRARRSDGTEVVFHTRVRIDTPQELRYHRHGGILPYVLRHLVADHARPPVGGVATAARPKPDGGKVEEGSEESFPASDPPTY